MNTPNQPLPNETEELSEILTLLQNTFSGSDTKKVDEAKNKLKAKFTDFHKYTSLLFKALSLKSINNQEISLDLHKSVLIYIKTILINNQKELKATELFECINNLVNLLFDETNPNKNLSHHSILDIIQNIIQILLNTQKIMSEQSYIDKIFQKLLTTISNANQNNFLKIGKIVVNLCSSLLTSKSADKNNFETLLNNYYKPIADIVFKNVLFFINPKNDIYNNDYIYILKILFDGFYINLTKIRNMFATDQRKEIVLDFFQKYGTFSYELMQINPPFDEQTKKIYQNSNPILVFNADETKVQNINNMKSKTIQFLSFVIQMSAPAGGTSSLEENKNYIDTPELVELVKKVIFLIIKSFEDILSNKEKYYFIRKYNAEVNDEDDCFNLLLFQMCVFLSRSLIREPIKSEFSANVRQFLLNDLFPMIVTIDDEKNFMEMDPETYHVYINDITTDFKIKNFRTSACFLIQKISEKFDDMINFVLLFSIEMFNYIINNGHIIQNGVEYNVYLKNISNSMIKNFPDEIKLDFSFLIILILKQRISKNSFFRERLRNLLIDNQEKLHQVTSPVIKIKICKIYNYFLTDLFNNEKNMNNEKEKNYTGKAIEFLLNNIVQTKNDYLQALSYEASDTLTELLDSSSNFEQENNYIYDYISDSLKKNFGILNSLIGVIDASSFYSIINQVINNITINERNLIFECLENLSKKFKEVFIKKPTNENKLYIDQYFTIISSFLSGKNKLDPANLNEIEKFNHIFEPILAYIKNPKKIPFYEGLVSTTEEYIKALKGVNLVSATVLKNMSQIIDMEKNTSSTSYTFVSTFLIYIQNNICKEPLDQAELFNEILIFIKKSFTFKDDTYSSSKIYALLLILQILNLNPNLSNEVMQFLLIESLNNYKLKQNINDFDTEWSTINQLSLANVSLGFVFRPEQTLNILIENKDQNNENSSNKFESFINMLFIYTNMHIGDYVMLLNKCIILGLCGLFSNRTCLDFLDTNKKLKIFLLQMFYKNIVYHKKELTDKLAKLMKKELNCNFVEDEEESEEEEDDTDNEFEEKVEIALSGNDNIKKSDEFKFFNLIMKNLEKTDNYLFGKFLSNMSDNEVQMFEEISKVRNINIKYNGKEYCVPRKTVRIKRNGKNINNTNTN